MKDGAVVHVVVAGEVGGAERMLVDLARYGGARRHSIALFTPSARLRDVFRGAGLEVFDRGPVRETPLSYLVRSLGPADVSWIENLVERQHASIVHLHTFGSQVVGTRAARRVGARLVRTEHSTRVYEDPTCWPFSRWSLARADAVVCVSGHVSRIALQKAPWAAMRTRVITNGIDTRHFAPASVPLGLDAAHARSRAGPVRFVCLGRLDPRKGLDMALRALARVPNAVLDIVGDGDEKAPLVDLARRLGIEPRVRFVGFVDDVRQSIEEADIALSSARAEGLGIALLEAMAMELPVVALPTGGIPEVVTDGVTGWLAAKSDEVSLASAMQEAVSHRDEVVRRGKLARLRVEARFSLAVMRSGYERLYEGL